MFLKREAYNGFLLSAMLFAVVDIFKRKKCKKFYFLGKKRFLLRFNVLLKLYCYNFQIG